MSTYPVDDSVVGDLLSAKSLGNFFSRLLVRKKKANRRYTMRALARDLKLSPAMLSLVILEKRNLSEKQTLLFSSYLKLNEEQNALLSLLCEAQQRKVAGKKIPPSLSAKIEEIKAALSITLYQSNQFKNFDLSPWYTFAVFQCFYLRNMEPTSQNIAAKLGLPIKTVEKTIDQFVTMRFLERRADGSHIPLEVAHSFTDSELDDRHQRYFNQLADLSKVQKPSDIRGRNIMGAVILPFDPDYIDALRKELDNLGALMEMWSRKSDQNSEIYAFYYNFFDIAKANVARGGTLFT